MLSRLLRFNLCKPLILFLAFLLSVYFILYVTISSGKLAPIKKNRLNSTDPAISSLQATSWNNDQKSQNVDVMVLFSKTSDNHVIQSKFANFVHSLLKHASVPVTLHIVGDAASQKIAEKIFSDRVKILQAANNYKIIPHNLNKITKKLSTIVSFMQEHFSYKPGSYYSDALFFISLALHRIFNLNRVVMTDVDVVFNDDVWKLYQHFANFSSQAIIGIANEQQPVYRHVFQLFRANHSNTSVGNPSPGIPGFNSGVLLLELDKMRKSTVYNKFLDAKVVGELANKYQFKGHLGDQDFFTLISLENMELFYVLPCGWNRQLCTWWRDHGYSQVFDSYHQCQEPIYLYHGNCNSKIDI